MPDKIRHISGPDDFAAAFNVSRETIARLKTYEALLRQWQKTINLVGSATLDDIWHRHFADSAQLLGLAPAARTWVDLGSGAGFPGLVISLLLADRGRPRGPCRPTGDRTPPCGEGRGVGEGATAEVVASPPLSSTRREGPPPEGTLARVTLIESDTRKCAFLREVARQTGLSEATSAGVFVDILSIRIETAATHTRLQAPEIVSARALAPLARLLELAAPLFASHTVGLFLKGRDAAKDLEDAQRTWDFRAELVQSRTGRDGRIVVVRRPKSQSQSQS